MMSWLLSALLLGLLWAAPAHAQICTPNPNASGPPFTDNCPPSTKGLNAYFGVGLHVPTNTALTLVARTNTFQPTYAIREGFASVGDGGQMSYTFSAAGCSLNSGAGDNGSQVPALGSGCWLWSPPAAGADLRVFGATFGGQADTALKAAIAAACINHVPVLVPYPGNNPFLLNSEIDIGNGSSSSLSTCNGVTLKGAQSYDESTSGTSPPGLLHFKWNGSSGVVPFVVKGPLTQVTVENIGVNCTNGVNSCSTGFTIDNPISGQFRYLGVEGNVGPGFIITSEPVNTWNGANEGSHYEHLFASAPGSGGSGMQVGSTTCGTCTISVIANLFDNLTLNWDQTTANTYGINFGFANQNTFKNLRLAPVSGTCGSGNSIVVTPPPGATTFPTNNLLIHPLVQCATLDPGASWTGTVGFTVVDWSRGSSQAFPTSTDYALWTGTDDGGNSYPASLAWTPTDISGAGLSFSTGCGGGSCVRYANAVRNGTACTIDFDITGPTTASGTVASWSGIPSFCRPVHGTSGHFSAGGALSYTGFAGTVTAIVDAGGDLVFYTSGSSAISNTQLSGLIVRGSLTWPVN